MARDHGKIIFKSGALDNQTTEDQLWLVNPDGSGLQQITPGTTADCGGDEEPSWSADGTKIVFSRTDDSGQNVWTMNADGSNQQKLTNDGDGVPCDIDKWAENPSWSPDGTKIIYTKSDGTNEDLWMMNADGSNQHFFFGDPGSEESEAFFSPNGTKIVFQIEPGDGSGQIWLMNADGSNPEQLISSATGVQRENYTWSPDGTKIAYTKHDSDATGCLSMNSTSNSDDDANSQGSEGAAAQTTNPQTSGDATPDGDVGAAAQRAGDEVWVIDVATKVETQLTDCIADTSSEHPAWSADGTKIVFANGGNNDQIWIMNADGSNPTQMDLGALEDNGQPDWQPIPIPSITLQPTFTG